MTMLHQDTPFHRVRRVLSLPQRIASGFSARTSWQAQKRNSWRKVELIAPELEMLGCYSVLDIGCNAGEVTRLLGRRCFAVGIDKNVDTRGFDSPLRGACLGEIELDRELIGKIPTFDAILLLSVHHQWVAHAGEDVAAAMIKALVSRARKAFFIEFASLNAKYGRTGEEPLFRDNDEASVVAYATAFLERTLSDFDARCLGSAPESALEAYRYTFVCTPKRR